MHAVLITIFSLMPSAPAQGYGYGAYGALNCDLPYRAARGAVSQDDVLYNNQGLIRHARAQLQRTNYEISRLNDGLAMEHRQLQQFLGAPGVRAVDFHQQYGGGPQGYQPRCGEPPAVAGPPIPGGVQLQPTPREFCVNAGGAQQNLWTSQFAGPAGRVNDTICGYQPGYRMQQSPQSATLCRRILNDYYERLALRDRLRQRALALKDRIQSYQIEEIEYRDGLVEGRVPCVGCQAEVARRRAAPVSNELNPLMQILTSVLGGGNRGPGRGGFAGNAPGFGNGAGPYPSTPYAARLRGYYGARGGQYGGVPGGIGRGAFAGCGGAGALGLGAQFAPPVQPALNSRGINPLGSEYSSPLIDPSAENALFNPGFGAGFAPSSAYAQRDAPDVLPMLGGNQGGQRFQPQYGQQPQYGLQPQYQTQFQPQFAPQTQFAPQPPYVPAQFGQASRYVPNQLGFGNVANQFAVNPNVYRPQQPPPPYLPMIGGSVPAFGVGQGVSQFQNYQYLNAQVSRAQYGLGFTQPQIPLPPPPVMPMGYVNTGVQPVVPAPVVAPRPPTPATSPAGAAPSVMPAR